MQTDLKSRSPIYLNLNPETLFMKLFWIVVFTSIFIKSVALVGYVHQNNFNHKMLLLGGILVYSAFILVLLAFGFLFKNKGRVWFLIVSDLAVSLLFAIDVWYFRAYGNYASIHLLKETANLENLSDSIFSMTRMKDFAFFIDILPLAAVAVIFRSRFTAIRRSIRSFLIVFLSSAVYIAGVSILVDLGKVLPGQTFFYSSWVPTRSVNQLSPLGYHYFDVFLFFTDSHRISLSKNEKNDIQAWYANKQENLPDNKYKGMFKGKNLILIQVESLENFMINQKISGQEVTPNLNRLLKNGIYFDQINEQINNGGSTDADLMANTSIYPVRMGSTFFRFPDNVYHSLPLLMQDEGYSTVAIHPDRGAYWNWLQSLKSIGFQRCIDSEYFQKDEQIGLGLSDGSFLRQVEPILKQQKQPFYSFMVTLTSHSPFNLPSKYRELNMDSSLNNTRMGGYLQSVHYTDKQIGTFLDQLDKDGILDNSVVAIYGDHCGVHRYYRDTLTNLTPWEDWFRKTNTLIPFIIYQKNIAPEVRDTLGGHIDIMPTVAYLMGIDDSKLANSAMGRNLLNTKKNFVVTANSEYIGDAASEEGKQAAIKGIDYADLMIRSNYFKK